VNKDVRVAVGYPRHKKTKRLLRLLGEKGVVAHITLLCYVGEFNPDGNLFGMSNEEIADAAGWTEDPDTFVSTLIDPVGYLDDVPGRGKRIHDWNDWNGYAAHAKQRSASAKKAARARWARSNGSCDPHSDPDSGSDAEGNAPSPSPSPVPSPVPSPEPSPAPPAKRAARPPAFAPPTWVPLEAWNAWVEMRAKQGKKPTDRALALAVKKLADLKLQGHPSEDVLNQSVFNSWTGLWPIKREPAQVGLPDAPPERRR